ncbi:hypothetical protein RGQ29_012032 [Quercus rubra]|uniref:rRNA biogenesis protein RRP36 n=1 Tax=Quercus rubra TaxID=3512 RepID=A0AAN7J9Q3_QUERU|nr:hypothetical protein RGQ29_012032 [Quercus rubra]
MKKTDYLVSNSTKTKFKDSGECELSSFENEDRDEHELSSLEDVSNMRLDGSHWVYKKPNQEKKSGLANKNRPMKASCKKLVGRLREAVQIPKRVLVFILCKISLHQWFRSKYNFLFKKYLPDEIKEEQKILDKSKDPYAVNRFKHSIVCMRGNQTAEAISKSNDAEIVDELKNNISWIDKQLKSESVQHTDAAILAEHKKKQGEAAKKGKQPFYLSKSAIRQQRLIEKYEDLKASGKLDTFIEKRRKKNVAKHHRCMPYRSRRSNRQRATNLMVSRALEIYMCISFHLG